MILFILSYLLIGLSIGCVIRLLDDSPIPIAYWLVHIIFWPIDILYIIVIYL